MANNYEVTGRITDEQFGAAIRAFCKTRPDWSIERVSNEGPAYEYLRHKSMFPLRVKKTTETAADDDVLNDMLQEYADIEQEDPGAINMMKDVAEDDCQETISGEYHVVYSPSFSVPVLYFTLSRSNGSLLDLDSLFADAPEPHRARFAREPGSVVTQMEHPLLRRPFYQLHPCHTAEMVKIVSTMGGGQSVAEEAFVDNYIWRWLSAVGPVAKLHVGK